MQRQVGKHMGWLTTFIIRKYKNIEHRLDQTERDLDVLTVHMSSLSLEVTDFNHRYE